jgi:hypothetical protein
MINEIYNMHGWICLGTSKNFMALLKILQRQLKNFYIKGNYSSFKITGRLKFYWLKQ